MAVILLFVSLSLLGSVFGASTSKVINFGNLNINSEEVNSLKFNLMDSMTFEKDGKCTFTVRITGKGVYDTFDSECNIGMNNNDDFTSIANENYAVYEDGTKQLALFTDTPSTLVVFQGDSCTKRTYTTAKTGTTITESPMTHPECDEEAGKMKEAKTDWSKKFENELNSSDEDETCSSDEDSSSDSSDEDKDSGNESSKKPQELNQKQGEDWNF